MTWHSDRMDFPPPCNREPRLPTALPLTLLALFLISAVAPYRAIAESTSCLTPICHGPLLETKVVHPPAAEDCLGCHASASASHPSGKGPDFPPSVEGAALCFQCHDQESFSHPVTHGPAASGACTYCHSPHGGDSAAMLKRPLRDLCLSCHTTMAEDLRQGELLHSAITEQECISCHQPHGSTRKQLLLKEGQELCFDCHEEIGHIRQTAAAGHQTLFAERGCGACHSTHVSDFANLLNTPAEQLCLDCHNKDNPATRKLRDIRAEVSGKKYQHAPLAEEGCSACHNPHGSSSPLLLNQQYPAGVYAPFTKDTYAFCFQCHEAGAFTEQYTENLTSFRNGKRNLHFLHANQGNKGRTCQMCHNPHASDVEHLINTAGMPFGKWRIPVEYLARENGGRCAPGCHREIEYDRATPLDYEKQATREE